MNFLGFLLFLFFVLGFYGVLFGHKHRILTDEDINALIRQLKKQKEEEKKEEEELKNGSKEP